MKERNEFEQGPFKQDNLADLRRIFSLLKKRWYLITISLILSFASAYLTNRYTSRVFSINTSILIKGSSEISASAADLLYGNQFFQNANNLSNESIMLKSFPLIYQTVKDLEFNKVFYNKGDLKTSPVYKDFPIRVNISEKNSSMYSNKKWDFQIKDDNSFYFTQSKDDGDEEEYDLYNFGDSIKVNGFKISITKSEPDLSLDKYIGNEYEFKLLSLEQIAKTYQKRLFVEPINRESSILTLSITGQIPDKEIDFLNKLTELYIQNDLNEKNSNATSTIEFINNQLRYISDTLTFIEDKMQGFKKRNQTADISQDGLRIYNRLDGLLKEKAEVMIQLNYFNYIEDYIRSNSEDVEQILVPSSLGVDDPVLNSLIEDLIITQTQRLQLVKSNNVENPFLDILSSKVTDLKNSILENVKNLKGGANAVIDQVDKRIAVVEEELGLLPVAQREFINIQREYNLSESLYLFLMEKRAEAAITRASTTSDIRIVNPPAQLGGPIQPKIGRNFLIAFFLGITIPIVLVIIGNYFNNRVIYKADIEKLTRIPFLGMIGHSKLKNNLVLLKYPKSSVSESFRSIRSNLSFLIPNTDKRTILITSSLSGEGKTFCSVNIATVFSLSNRKVIIIGADLRKPKIYTDFGLNNDIGLSNYLASSAKLSDVIQKTPVENIDVISGGPVPPNPAELLMSPRISELFDHLQETYDDIIIDTPPVGIVTDAFNLIKYADHVIYMVRQNYTPRDTISNIDEIYTSGKIKHISILLNDVKVRKYGYGYGYGSSYAYGNGYGYFEEKDWKSWKRIKQLF